MSRIFTLFGINQHVLGYVDFEFVFLRKTWNMPILKLQVCNLILFSAAALSNKIDLLLFNLDLIDNFPAVMNADHCLLSKTALSEKNSPIIFLSQNKLNHSFAVCDQTIMDGCFLSYSCILNLNKTQSYLSWSTFFIKNVYLTFSHCFNQYLPNKLIGLLYSVYFLFKSFFSNIWSLCLCLLYQILNLTLSAKYWKAPVMPI